MPITQSEGAASPFKKLANQAIIADNATGNTATGYCAIATGVTCSAAGDYSYAGGSGCSATGYANFAHGLTNTVTANRATAFGAYNTASGDFATALNRGNTASGQSAIAVNRENISSGASCFAGGYLCTASGDGSFVHGWQCISNNDQSNATGRNTTASGDFSNSTNYLTTASGTSSHAEGQSTTASAIASHSGGLNSVASRYSEWARSNGTRGQYGITSASAFSTNATPFILYLNESSERFTIPADKAYKVKLECVVINYTTGDAIEYEGKGLIKNLAGTTTLVGAFTMASTNGDAGLAATAITVTADDVNDCLQIQCTGIADSLDWFCKISYEAVNRL